jgi:hypothetical protein
MKGCHAGCARVESGIPANEPSARMEASHPAVEACAAAVPSYATMETWPTLEMGGAGETAMEAAGNAAGIATVAGRNAL